MSTNSLAKPFMFISQFCANSNIIILIPRLSSKYTVKMENTHLQVYDSESSQSNVTLKSDDAVFVFF